MIAIKRTNFEVITSLLVKLEFIKALNEYLIHDPLESDIYINLLALFEELKYLEKAILNKRFLNQYCGLFECTENKVKQDLVNSYQKHFSLPWTSSVF